jgi:hypothetical protein
MGVRELWLLISFFVVALGASISLVVSATYIPLKKIPNALKILSSTFYQKLYLLLVFCLFLSLIGLGIYTPLVFDLLRAQNPSEVVRAVLFVVYTITLLILTLSFKKQTLTASKMVLHATFASALLVIATQESTLDFLEYPYILLILALFAIVRYGVRTLNKKL